MMRKLRFAIFVLALLGLVVSSYSYLHNQNFTSGEFCSIGETFNCDVVNKGPYGKIGGIPVSAIGMIGYGFVLLAASMKLRKPKDVSLTKFIGLASGTGLLFSFYLTGVEAFILETYCLLCLTSQAIILVLFILVAKLWYTESCKGRHKPRESKDV